MLLIFDFFLLIYSLACDWHIAIEDYGKYERGIILDGYTIAFIPSLLFSTFGGNNMCVYIPVSQVEYGVLNLLDAEHPQMTVLMDCGGLSPFGFPVKTFRSCALLLQDHYPNRLGCLLVVRLPSVARVITQTLFQVSLFSLLPLLHH